MGNNVTTLGLVGVGVKRRRKKTNIFRMLTKVHIAIHDVTETIFLILIDIAMMVVILGGVFLALKISEVDCQLFLKRLF